MNRKQQNQHNRRRENRRSSSRKKATSRLKNWAVFSGIGLQMGLMIYLGNILGKWADAKYQLDYLENTFTLLAVFGAMFSVIVKLKRFNAED